VLICPWSVHGNKEPVSCDRRLSHILPAGLRARCRPKCTSASSGDILTCHLASGPDDLREQSW